MSSSLARWGLVLIVLVAAAVLAQQFVRLNPSAPRFSEPQALENAFDPQYMDIGQDVPGRDLRTVPRYLPSVRIFFAEEQTQGAVGTSFMVMYRCQAGLDKVSAYYELQMPKYGWRLATKNEDILHMDFIREDARQLGPPLVQMDFQPIEENETAVSILAVNAPGQ